MAAPLGSRTLSLLCRKARRAADNQDVAAIVRGFLVIDLGKCRDDEGLRSWLQKCFWDCMPRVPSGVSGTLCIGQVRGNVHIDILPRVRFPSGADNDLEPSDEAALDSESESSHEADFDLESSDEGGIDTAQVCIELRLIYTICQHVVAWKVRSWHDSPRQEASGPDLCRALDAMRLSFDRRCCARSPSGSMEIPTTLAAWLAFMRLWLFGPTAPKQQMLQKWLRPALGQ